MKDATAARYRELFNAVYANDAEKVTELCTPNEKGDCLFVSSAGAGNLPLLGVAANRGNRAMLHLLFELLEKQYTPIPVVKKVSQSERISNYALVSGETEEEDAFIDPNAMSAHIINTCPPSVALMEWGMYHMEGNKPYFAKETSNDYRCYYGQQNEEEEADNLEKASLMQYLVYRGDVELFCAVLEEIRVLSEKVWAKQLKANMVKEEDRKTKTLLQTVFTSAVSFGWSA